MGGRPMCGAVPQGESSCHRQGGLDEYPSDEPEPRPGRRAGLPPRAAAGRGHRRATGPRRTRTPRPADRPPDRPAPRARPPGRGGPHRPRPARGLVTSPIVSGPAPASGGAGPDTIGDVTRAGAETPFVGRADDVRRMLDAVRDARDGDPSGWLVAGDAGVGKTRYLREVGALATEAGARVVTGRCVDLGAGGLPYLPFAEVVGQLADDTDLTAYPALASLTGGSAADGPTAVDADGDRRLPLFDAVRSLLANAGERAGALVVVLEDLHWADRSSRDLLHFLLARLRSEPVAVSYTHLTLPTIYSV